MTSTSPRSNKFGKSVKVQSRSSAPGVTTNNRAASRRSAGARAISSSGNS